MTYKSDKGGFVFLMFLMGIVYMSIGIWTFIYCQYPAIIPAIPFGIGFGHIIGCVKYWVG